MSHVLKDDVAVINLPKDELLGVVIKAHAAKAIIIAARGTVDSDIKDWIDDAEFWQDKFAPTAAFKGALVEHGFNSAWEKLRVGMVAAFAAALADPATKGYTVMATGHSLGASISAVMTAELLAGAGLNASSSGPILPADRSFMHYTFGEPRTGNKVFASAVAALEANYAAGAHTWRVVNKKDIVPHIPLKETLGFTYWHQSTEVWLAPNGSTVICNGSGEDAACSDSIPLIGTHPADHTTYYGWDAGPCAPALQV